MLLTGIEVAKKLNISNTTFHTVVKKQLPFVIVAGKKKYDLKDVEDYIEKMKVYADE